MSIERSQITVSGVRVQVHRKAIKNLHLGVYPPHGRVRVAAPLRLSDDAVRLAIIGKLGWIRRQRAKFEAQPRQSRREMVSGESHYYLGRRYRLCVVEQAGPTEIRLRSRRTLELRVPPGASTKRRDLVLQRWYRQKLKELIPPLIEKWQGVLEVTVAEWGVKRMKTKWGTCNAEARRIWLNLELAKKPGQCLEYIVAHELVHLIERHHNDRFVRLLDQHLPSWRQVREQLNAAPLGPAQWEK